MKLFRIVLAFKVRSAMVWKYEYIFSRIFFILVMEKKSSFGVLLAHFQAGGQKSPLYNKMSLKLLLLMMSQGVGYLQLL